MPGKSLDVKRIVGIVAKDSPDLLDALVDALFEIDEGIASPELLLNFIAGDDLARATGQHGEQFEGLGRKAQE